MKAQPTSNDEKTVIVQLGSGSNGLGIASLITGIVSIFILAPIFATIVILCGLLGLKDKQYALSIIGLICAVIGLGTSPLFWGILGLASATS